MNEYFAGPNSLGQMEKLNQICLTMQKADLQNATGFDTSSFAKRTDLVELKSDIDKLYIDKLKNVPSGLRRFKK